MSTMSNPFANNPSSRPGHGIVVLGVLPPNTPVFQTLTYQYPLKLISPAPHNLSTTTTATTTSTSTPSPSQPNTPPRRRHPTSTTIHTLFLLTYGGGLVAGDTITLSITLHAHTRLILLTQGSTKLFAPPARDPTRTSAQRTTVRIGEGAALCWLPDPAQPFAGSAFAQTQVFEVECGSWGSGGGRSREEGEGAREGRAGGDEDVEPGSLCVLDYVSAGRVARGENWAFRSYASKNEIWLCPTTTTTPSTDPTTTTTTTPRHLLLRDNLLLRPLPLHPSTHLPPHTITATLLLHGPLFDPLSTFFLAEFAAQPRLGGRSFSPPPPPPSSSSSSSPAAETPAQAAPQPFPPPKSAPLDAFRAARAAQERADGIVWSAARTQVSDVV
ncbi:UreD urease accessory protein-domain-containing protein [Lineolata rhizophorae]|uniref:UreD urease accessory protein-domain-containing protein n=1 Tax=Lineolata rhizophorae TaxID=578093 RepID=A0A6A6NNE7_9PEZI|nr:UreD urease accessory protein-domain-containing protein [Lineolata rhizophorae]